MPDAIMDLKTGRHRASSPGDYCTKQTTVSAGGECPLWDAFLKRVTNDDAELAAFLQRICGYCLTGSTKEHALFFLHGTGANGKSVFIDTVAGILGDYHRTAPIETFTASPTDRHPTDIASLRGARLVTAVETEEGRRWDESKIKALTGGDMIAARFMRQDFFEYRPQFKLVIAGNHKPGLRSVDEAIRRRFHLIPFNVTIPEGERDLELAEKLRAEWPGILAWMIEGCLDWQRQGPCATSRRGRSDGGLPRERGCAVGLARRMHGQEHQRLCHPRRALCVVAALGRSERRICDSQTSASSQRSKAEDTSRKSVLSGGDLSVSGFVSMGHMAAMAHNCISDVGTFCNPSVWQLHHGGRPIHRKSEQVPYVPSTKSRRPKKTVFFGRRERAGRRTRKEAPTERRITTLLAEVGIAP